MGRYSRAGFEEVEDVLNTVDNASIRTAKRVAAEYSKNRKFVRTMETVRPSILLRLGINTEGYLPFAYELPNRRLPEKDRRIVEEYLDRRRKKEAVEITVEERVGEGQKEIIRSVFIDGMKNAEASRTYDVSVSTVNRMRKNAYEELVCELILAGICCEENGE